MFNTTITNAKKLNETLAEPMKRPKTNNYFHHTLFVLSLFNIYIYIFFVELYLVLILCVKIGMQKSKRINLCTSGFHRSNSFLFYLRHFITLRFVN